MEVLKKRDKMKKQKASETSQPTVEDSDDLLIFMSKWMLVCAGEQQYVVYLYIVNFNLDENDNVRWTVTPKKSGTCLQTEIHTNHVIVAKYMTENLKVSYQTASRMKSQIHYFFSFLTSSCQNHEWFTDAWLRKQKTWEKLVLKCHEDHFSQQHTSCAAVLENSLIAVDLWYVCLWPLHAECYILFFYLDVSLYCWNRLFQLPLCVWMLLTLSATSSVWGSVCGLLPCHTCVNCKYVRLDADSLSCPSWLYCNAFNRCH